MGNSTSKGTVAGLAGKLTEGTQKHFAPGTQLTVEGTAMTPADIEAKLNEIVSLQKDVDAARAAVQAKVATQKARLAVLRAFVSAFVRIVRGSFGNLPDVLADFGLEPRKPPTPLTTEEKAAAAAKRAATRAARGTKGKRAKAKIHGAVTGVVVTAVTAQAPAAVTDATRGGNAAPANVQAPSATPSTTSHS